MTVGSATANYSYDDASRLTTVTPPSPASAISYTWDNNGDLAARGSDRFGWDYEDRMTSATVGSSSFSFGRAIPALYFALARGPIGGLECSMLVRRRATWQVLHGAALLITGTTCWALMILG